MRGNSIYFLLLTSLGISINPLPAAQEKPTNKSLQRAL